MYVLKEIEIESMVRGILIVMFDSVLVIIVMFLVCINSMLRKLLCKIVWSDILFVCVSY